MSISNACPQYGSTRCKKNGHNRHGKQNHHCKVCRRSFVADATDHSISREQRTLVERLLCERLALRGICRAVGGSLPWLLPFMVECFVACPDHLHVQSPTRPTDVVLRLLEAEAEELWSFVPNKANKQWVWLAMDARTRQIIAFHVGDRRRGRANALWAKIPLVYREQARFHTDQ